MKPLSFFIILILPIVLHGQNATKKNVLTAEQVIQIIIKQTGSAPIPNTVDVFKEGDPATPVTGIVTCMFATMDVLKQAVGKGCNLIITHEPIYYNHFDDTKQLKDDPILLEKKAYINNHNLIIWRFHDYIHSMQPDGILSGMVTKLGWKNYSVDNHLEQFAFPETTLKGLLESLKRIFPKNAFYVVGNPDMKVSKVCLAPGASGSSTHIHFLEVKDVDVVIAGEGEQWETYEYTRDAVALGKNKAVIFLGHIPSEESGMVFCQEWLSTFIKDLPIYFIECNPSYWSY